MSNSQRPRVHVATVTRVVNGKTYVSHLLRPTYREGGKVKNRTVASLTCLPPDLIDLIRRRLRSDNPVEVSNDGMDVTRSLPHGHVAAVLGTIRKLGLDKVISSTPCRQAKIILGLLAMRIIAPGSKLTHLTAMREASAQTTIAQELDIQDLATAEIYDALDWLLARQVRIENKLARQQLAEGALLMYDVSSSYYTGSESSLIKHGYSRDGRPADPQIVYGLLCAANGCPVAIEVFPGNTADPKCFSSEVRKVTKRFKLGKIVFVGDRGMITSARINDQLKDAEGLDWITALRSVDIRLLADEGTVNKSVFDASDHKEVSSKTFPGERLIICRNAALAEERQRKRAALLATTREKLDAIAKSVARTANPLRGKDKIGLRIGRDTKTSKMMKHFELTIEDDAFSYRLKEQSIAREAALDGIYVIRTSVPIDTLSAEQTIGGYKGLSRVERAFRSMKTTQIELRPIYHYKDDRIRAHVLLCMLAYYVEWHMRRCLRPILFEDHDPDAATAKRQSIVAKAQRSDAAVSKDRTRTTEDGLPVQSFRSLLKDLGTICRNTIQIRGVPEGRFNEVTQPTELQKKAFALLGIELNA